MAVQFASYIKSLLTVGICAFLCENIISNKALSRGMNFITSLCIFTVIISPVLSFIFKGNIKEIFDTAECKIASDTPSVSFYSLIEDEMEKEISDEIFKEFGIHPVDIIIKLSVKDDVVTTESADVTVEGANSSKCEEINTYMQGIFGGETKITVTEKNK